MAKRRNDKRRKSSRSRKGPPSVPDLPDRRALEGSMRELVQKLGGNVANPVATQAQDLLQEAFETRNPNKRIQLAKQALELDPNCADACVLLAENAPTRKEALSLYEQGVSAGQRALGPEAFQQAGHFWGILETRPYMRARAGLALALWTAGRRDEAIAHLQEMLRLNPSDNQGMRYTLAGFLLFLDRDAEAAQLLEQYPQEATATWAYTKALLEFRRHGDTPAARQLLQEAKRRNRYVPAYLLGRKPVPAEQPAYYALGDESEAVEYVHGFLAPWRSTLGAVAWLRANDEQAKKQEANHPHPKGPLSFIKKWLRERLPQMLDVWQADCRQLPKGIRVAGELMRPWHILVTSRTNDLILSVQSTEDEPTPELVWDILVQAMQHPAAGEAHRPTELQVSADPRWIALRGHLEDIGVPMVVPEHLDHWEFVFDGLCQRLCGDPQPSMLDVPGITLDAVGRFYEAAADFYMQAPWKKVGYESTIKVLCDQRQSGPYYGVLMGQSGLMVGMALYEDFEILRRMWRNPSHQAKNFQEAVGTTISFGEAAELPLIEVQAAQKHGWKVARPDAYPSIFHKERGSAFRPPLAWELELMEACLRAVPGFVNRRRQDDPTEEKVVVPAASGEMLLTLSWVVEE